MDPDENTALDAQAPGAPPATGAIDTSGSDPNDNSGAAPVAAPQGAIDTSDNSGAAPVVAPQAQQAPAPGSVNSPSYGPLAGVADKIKKLLGGEGAVNPQLLDQIAQKSDPTGQMSPADKQVAAIHDAYTKQGPDAAMALLQANRVAYGTKAAFARTALQGTAQKPADLKAAINAANQAQENLPDGSNVIFSPNGRSGVIAVAQMPGSKKSVQFNLSIPQFADFLDVGGNGQFDKLMDTSAPAMLQKLAQANAGGAQAPAPQTSSPAQPQAQAAAPAAPKKPYNWAGNNPSAVDLSGETSPRAPATDEQRGIRDPELEGQAARMFPNASQDKQKQQWIAQQEQQEAGRQNAIDVASEKGKRALDVAKATGTGRVQAAQATAQGRVTASENYSKAKVDAANAKMSEALKLDEAKNGRNSANIAGRALNAKIAAQGYNSLSDPEKKVFAKFLEGGQQQAAPAAAQPQAGADANAGKKFFNGKWYSRDEYKQAFGK